jgi:hypothetical protein
MVVNHRVCFALRESIVLLFSGLLTVADTLLSLATRDFKAKLAAPIDAGGLELLHELYNRWFLLSFFVERRNDVFDTFSLRL